MEVSDDLIVELAADVRALKQSALNTEKRLFGNGQPGELARLEGKIETVKAHADLIDRKVEEKINISRGAKMTLSILGGSGFLGFVTLIFHLIFGKH